MCARKLKFKQEKEREREGAKESQVNGNEAKRDKFAGNTTAS